MRTHSDGGQEDDEVAQALGDPTPPHLEKDGREVAVPRQVLGVEEQSAGELNQDPRADEDERAEEEPHLAHGVGDGEDARPDHRLDDGGGRQEEVCLGGTYSLSSPRGRWRRRSAIRFRLR